MPYVLAYKIYTHNDLQFKQITSEEKEENIYHKRLRWMDKHESYNCIMEIGLKSVCGICEMNL